MVLSPDVRPEPELVARMFSEHMDQLERWSSLCALRFAQTDSDDTLAVKAAFREILADFQAMTIQRFIALPYKDAAASVIALLPVRLALTPVIQGETHAPH